MSAKLNTVRGEYKVNVKKSEGVFRYEISVPFGCTAELVMPDGREYSFGSGDHFAEASI